MPCKRVSLSIGTPWGDLEGIRLPGLFERKEWYIWVPSLDPEDIKILSLGAIWNRGKGTGLSWADIRLWGTKGSYIRPRCIGTVRARTQCQYTPDVTRHTGCHTARMSHGTSDVTENWPILLPLVIFTWTSQWRYTGNYCTQSLFYLTTICCHFFWTLYHIHVAKSASRPNVWQSSGVKCPTAVCQIR